METKFLGLSTSQSIYQAIIEQNSMFVEDMAKCALANMTEVMVDMYNDNAEALVQAVPDSSDVRERARAIVADMVDEFKKALDEKIKTVPFEVAFRLKLASNITNL